MGEFKGFGKDALGFFRALKFHQDKAWFDENRAIYDEQVVAPLAALLVDLSAAFAKKKIPLKADVWLTYNRTVNIPLVGGTRTLQFNEHAEQELSPVKW